MRKTLSISLLAASLMLNGCVGRLDTRPERGFTDTGAALRGVSYALPKVRYEVKLTRALAECPGSEVDGMPTALKFSVSASASPTMVAGEAYRVDYERLPGWLRTANFEIKHYPNGTLKSIGAGAEDKTGEVINSAAKTALSLATVVGLSSGDRPVSIEAPAQLVKCTDAAAAMVAEARQVERDFKTATGKLEDYEKEAERLRAAGAADLMDAAGKQRYLKLFDDINAVQEDIEALTERQENLTKALGVSDSIVWNGGVTTPDYNKSYPLSAAQREKLAALLEIGLPPQAYPTDSAEAKRRSLMTACFDAAADKGNCLNQQLTLQSGIYLERDLSVCGREGSDATECRTAVPSTDPRYRDARDDIADSGIFIREPMVGRLLFCRTALLAKTSSAAQQQSATQTSSAGSANAGSGQAGSSGTGSAGTAGGTLEGGTRSPSPQSTNTADAAKPECTVAEDEVKIAAGDFPQFGQLRFLPLSVGMFQAREMALSLTETGRLESFTYKSTKAPAQGIAASAADVIGQYEAFREKRETERRDDAKSARETEIAELQLQIDRFTKEKQIKDLENPPAVDPLKAVRDETAREEAMAALASAKLARKKAEEELSALNGS